METDVVGLVGDDGGYVSLTANCAEEEAEIPDAVGGGVGCDHEADYADYGLEDDDGSADAPFVGEPGDDHTEDNGGDDGGSGE